MTIKPVAAIKAQETPKILKNPQVTAKSPTSPKKTRKNYQTGIAVTPYIDGPDIFKAAEKMIKSAKTSIQLEMFSLSHDHMIDLMCKESEKGVKVQVLIDPNPGFNDEEIKEKQENLKKLKASGVEVVYFPVNKDRRQIDHIKMLLVDGQSALIGGMNWSNHSPVNHDADIKIEGPAVNYYRAVFDNGWRKSGGEPGPVLPRPEKIPGADAELHGVSTEMFRFTGIKQAVIKNIENAQKSIHMEAFILTDKDILKGLKNAKQRGLDVKVILDPTLICTEFSINDKIAEELKDAGVEVKWYKVDDSIGQKLHAKWGLFDGEQLTIGSANMTFKGLYINREIGADVNDKKTGSVFEKQFHHDWEHASTDEIENRPAQS